MKPSSLIFLAAIGLLAGCATPFRSPPDVAHLRLERIDSPLVVVEKAWLERKNGPLAVTGYIMKRRKAGDTTGTHLDVTLYDAQGRKLRSTVAYFEPRQLVGRLRNPPLGTYRVPLDPLPAGTTRVEVRAHEGEHP